MARVTRGFMVRHAGLIAQIDRLVSELEARYPGRCITRAGIVRELLFAALTNDKVLRQVSGRQRTRGLVEADGGC